MSVRAIHGKPRSGKTCYCVYLIVLMLADWARFKKKHGKNYDRVLYTNIPLNIDAINFYLTGELGFAVDMSDQIVILDKDFFFNKMHEDKKPEPLAAPLVVYNALGQEMKLETRTASPERSYGEQSRYKEWWADFPVRAYIVIDEVHHYLPSSLRYKAGGIDYCDKFMEYISMHGHRQQDIILLSQHIDNVSQEVRKQMELIYEVLNLKSLKLPWPLSIPLSDIDEVRQAWGGKSQLAHIKRGVCAARSVQYDKGMEPFWLRPQLFALYRSHTLSNEAMDKPSLNLGRLGSLWWFARRHVPRLAMWAGIFVTVFFCAKNIFEEFPVVLTNSMLKKQEKKAEQREPLPTSPTHTVQGVPVPAPNNARVLPEDDKIIGLVRNGVITPKGIIRVDEHLTYEGEKDFVKSVDITKGLVLLGSGKKVQR